MNASGLAHVRGPPTKEGEGDFRDAIPTFPGGAFSSRWAAPCEIMRAGLFVWEGVAVHAFADQ